MGEIDEYRNNKHKRCKIEILSVEKLKSFKKGCITSRFGVPQWHNKTRPIDDYRVLNKACGVDDKVRYASHDFFIEMLELFGDEEVQALLSKLDLSG